MANSAPDSPRIGLIVQARLASSRLPGKALLPLPLGGDTTLFGQVLRRAARVKGAHLTIVALPDNPQNDPLAEAVISLGTAVYRGSEDDVLRRFAEAAAAHQLDIAVRLTADNPALDPVFVEEAIAAHLAANADYTVTTGLPLGMNVEVIRVTALAEAHAEATDPTEREHVTPFLRRRPERFQLQTLAVAVPAEAAEVRMTVDYPTDYAFQHLLFTTLGADYRLTDVLSLLTQHPWLRQINAANEQIKV